MCVAGALRICNKFVISVTPVTARPGCQAYMTVKIECQKTRHVMSPFFRFPSQPTTRYLVEWRRRIPSHEPMTLGALATADLACRKHDAHADAGKWFWRS